MNTIYQHTQKSSLNTEPSANSQPQIQSFKTPDHAEMTTKKSFAKSRFATLSLLPLVLPISIAVHAAENEGRFEITPYVGQNMFSERQNLKDSAVYGMRLGYYITDRFELEGGVGVVQSNVDDVTLVSGREGRYRSPTDGVDLMFYNIDALYNFTSESNFTPYLVVGLGGTHYKPSISDKDMATLNAGLGVKYAFNDTVALRLDVRDYLVGELFQESYHNVQTTLGIAFTLGNKARSPQAQTIAPPLPVSNPQPPKPAPAPIAAPALKEVVLDFDDVHFNFDQSELTPSAKQMLKPNISVLKNNPNTRVRIAGYTSASGTEEYNTALSQRRAKAIESFLISEGISANRLSIVGYGEANPAEHESDTTNLNSAPAKANMRALFEIVVHQ